MASKIIGQGTAAPIPNTQKGPLHNSAQLRAVMEQIAHQASALRDLLVQTSSTDEVQMAAVINASIYIVTSIGAMADENAAHPVLGDADEWLFGSAFADLGKEVRHV
jgi:hypothetical protein